MACYIAGSAIVLSATDAQAAPDQYDTGSVEVTLTPASMRRLSHVKSTHLGKELLLLRGKEAVLYFVIAEGASDTKFTLSAPSLQQAEVVARVLRGERER